MNNAKLLVGAVALSCVFLSVCLCVHFLFPPEVEKELLPASSFNSYTSLLDFDVAEDAT